MPNVTDGRLMDRSEFTHREPRIDLDDAKRLFIRSLVLASDGRVSFPEGRDDMVISCLEHGKIARGDKGPVTGSTDYHYTVVREQNPKLWMERLSLVVDFIRAYGSDSTYCKELGDTAVAQAFIRTAWMYLLASSSQQPAE